MTVANTASPATASRNPRRLARVLDDPLGRLGLAMVALILVFDAIRSFPTVLFALAVVTLIGPSLATIILVVVVTSFPVYGRIVRTQTLSIKTRDFVLAERAMGAGPIRVLVGHVIPNI